MKVVRLQAFAAAEERQLDDEGHPDHLGAEAFDQAGDCLDGAAGREHIVVNQYAVAIPDRLRMQLERILAVLERVGGADRLRGQLAGTSRRDEATANLARDRVAGPQDGGRMHTAASGGP